MAVPTTNLVSRYKASAGVTETGSGVSTWADQVGSNDLLQGTDANRPTLETDLDGRSVITFDGSTNYLETAGAFAVDRRDVSVFVCMRSKSTGSTDSIIHWGTSGSQLALYQKSATGSGTLAVYGTSILDSTDRMSHGITAYGFVGGAAATTTFLAGESASLAALTAGSTTAALRVGLWSGTSFPLGEANDVADIYEILIYDAALSASDYNAVLDYFAYTYGAASRETDTYILAEGDSLTEGSELAEQARDNWAVRMCGDRTIIKAPKLYNEANGGETAQAMVSQTQAATEIAANTGYTNVIAVLWAGTNDINGGRTEAQVEGDLDTIVSNLQTAGAAVLILTITPRTDFSAPEEAIRVAVNSHITAGNTGAEYVLDVAADSRLDDASDTTYYKVDGIHHNDAGTAVVADLVRDRLVTAGILTIRDAPTITGTYTVAVGETKDLTVTGTGFIDGIAASSTDAGFTVNSETWVSATEVTVNVTGVTAGTYTNDLVLTNPDGQSATGTVRVLASTTYDGTDNFVRAGAWYPLKLSNGGTFRFRS